MLREIMVDDIDKPAIPTRFSQQSRSRRSRRVQALPLGPDAEGLFAPGDERVLLDDCGCHDSRMRQHEANYNKPRPLSTYSLEGKVPHVTGFIDFASEAAKSPDASAAKYVTFESSCSLGWRRFQSACGKNSSTKGWQRVSQCEPLRCEHKQPIPSGNRIRPWDPSRIWYRCF